MGCAVAEFKDLNGKDRVRHAHVTLDAPPCHSMAIFSAGPGLLAHPRVVSRRRGESIFPNHHPYSFRHQEVQGIRRVEGLPSSSSDHTILFPLIAAPPSPPAAPKIVHANQTSTAGAAPKRAASKLSLRSMGPLPVSVPSSRMSTSTSGAGNAFGVMMGSKARRHTAIGKEKGNEKEKSGKPAPVVASSPFTAPSASLTAVSVGSTAPPQEANVVEHAADLGTGMEAPDAGGRPKSRDGKPVAGNRVTRSVSLKRKESEGGGVSVLLSSFHHVLT